MKKRSLGLLAAILIVLLATVPAFAQTQVYDVGVVSSAASSETIEAEFMGVKTQDGLVGPEYCAVKESARTQWQVSFEFPAVVTQQVVLLSASATVDTDFHVTNTDAQEQIIAMESKGVIGLSGAATMQLVAQDTDAQSLAPGAEFSKTVPAADSKSVSVTVPAGSLVVTATAKSGSSVTGPGNLDASVNTFASAEVCVFYGTEPAGIGDFVWFDQNKDGKQDTGELPIAGVSVLVSNTFGLSTTVESGPDGVWLVEGLPAGETCAQFQIPEGWAPTQVEVGDPSLDSNPVRTCVELAAGEQNLTIDQGFISLASLGGYVWYDANRNGLQDVGEAPIHGATLTLLQCVGGEVLVQTTTDENGYYSFGNLIPGLNYKVAIDAAYVLTLQDQNVNDSLDSDFNHYTHESSCSGTVAPGQQITTIDAGVLLSTNLLMSKTALTGTIAVSETAQFQIQVENTGEITASAVAVIDENDAQLMQMISSTEAYTSVEGGIVIWELGDIGPHQSISFTYTVKPNSGIPNGYLAHNSATVTTETSETIYTDNSDTADVSVLNPETQYTTYLPVVCNQQPDPEPEPEPVDPCKAVHDAVVHVLYRDRLLQQTIEFTATLSSVSQTGMIFPDGADTDYEYPVEVWVTGFQPNQSEGDQIRVIMYHPYYKNQVLSEGQHFVMDKGFPGKEIRIHVRVVDNQPQADGAVYICTNGTFLDGNVDP